MRRSRADFKRILKQVKANENSIRAESISCKLRGGKSKALSDDLKRNLPVSRQLPQQVDGIVGEDNIANLWREKYSNVLNSVDDRGDRDVLERDLQSLPIGEWQQVSAGEVLSAAGRLAKSTSAGMDGIPPGVLIDAPAFLYGWLANLFNSFFMHYFLPTSLSDVLIVSIAKNKHANMSDSSNYRPIAIFNSAFKLLGIIILERIHMNLFTSDNQFGFKKLHSTELCIYALKEVIQYYRDLNTSVFTAFIDIKSAFDRVSFYRLFGKLIKRGINKVLILFLRFLYETQQLYAAWGNSRSLVFYMKNGIRQGSVISPYIFNVYISDLNYMLSNSKVGCHVANKCMNSFSYADDLALVAPSAHSMNELLALCDKFASENHIIY